MKSRIAVLVTGLLIGTAAFWGFYHFGTASHRGLLHEQTPELAWLQKEFNLSDADLSRIARLHEGYQPHCDVMCQRIE